MCDQIYEIEPDDASGVYVTAENIDEHIAERQRRYNELMEEYKDTGTVWQGMYFDDGCVMSELFDPIVSNTGYAQAANNLLKNYYHRRSLNTEGGAFMVEFLLVLMPGILSMLVWKRLHKEQRFPRLIIWRVWQPLILR